MKTIISLLFSLLLYSFVAVFFLFLFFPEAIALWFITSLIVPSATIEMTVVLWTIFYSSIGLNILLYFVYFQKDTK